MILMSISIMGIIIIYLVVAIEGSMWINPLVLVHLILPGTVLALNIYSIMLEDKEEIKFFKRSNGMFLLNLTFLTSMVVLFFNLLYKAASKSSMEF